MSADRQRSTFPETQSNLIAEMQTVVFETKPYDREPISAPLVSARWRDGCIERDLIANDVHNRCRKRGRLRDIAQQFQNWLKNRCQKWGVPVLDAPEGGATTLSIPTLTLSGPRPMR